MEATEIPNHIKEQFAPYLEDTNRYLPACLRARYARLRDTAAAVDRIRDRLEAIRVGVERATVPRPDKNAGAS